MNTLHDVIAEVRANAHSAIGVVPTARRDGQALYAMSDAALLEALGSGGDPRERGPVESRDGAVPSNASEDQPPSANHPVPPADAAWLEVARGPAPDLLPADGARPTAPGSFWGPKGGPTPMRIGATSVPNSGTAMPNPGKRRPGRPPGSKNKKGPKKDPNEHAAGAPSPAHFGSNLTPAPYEPHDPDPWT